MNISNTAIIIPVHNGARWIEACVDSCIEQGSPVAEIIVVDDHSTDDTVNRLLRYSQQITLLRSPDRGGNAARNLGLQHARSAWLQFLDADDYLEPAKIARQLEEGGDLSSADVLYSPVIIEKWREGRAEQRTVGVINQDHDLFTQWISWQLPQTGAVLWRTEALRRIGGWDSTLPCCQEHELYLRGLQAGLRWRFCPTPGAVYRIWSEETVCRRDPLQVIAQRSRLIDRALAWLDQQQRRTPAHTLAAGQACFEMARTWARYDLPGAAEYFAGRKARGLIHLAGPAAPWRFRVALHLFGFPRAESLARARLRTSPLQSAGGDAAHMAR